MNLAGNLLGLEGRKRTHSMAEDQGLFSSCYLLHVFFLFPSCLHVSLAGAEST